MADQRRTARAQVLFQVVQIGARHLVEMGAHAAQKLLSGRVFGKRGARQARRKLPDSLLEGVQRLLLVQCDPCMRLFQQSRHLLARCLQSFRPVFLQRLVKGGVPVRQHSRELRRLFLVGPADLLGVRQFLHGGVARGLVRHFPLFDDLADRTVEEPA
jgi:hypothetical protein